jgi:RNA polymerase II subunit A small phosphatase-like protein
MFRGLLQDPDGRQRINRVTVFERPGLHEFLQRTSEFADLVLFTAGLEGLISSTIFLFRKQKQVDFTSRH